MARLDIVHPATEERPATTETIEARVWALAGTDKQPFYIGSGVNSQASGSLWLEIVYTIEGAQIFYTRTFFQHDLRDTVSGANLETMLEALGADEEEKFGFGGIFPETCIVLKAEKSSYEDEGVLKEYIHSNLLISADTGVVFGRNGPGSRSIDIKTYISDFEQGRSFMRDLIHEITAVQQGKHPNPADYPDGACEWPLVNQLNQMAYDKISADYQESYFENPLLAQAFGQWTAGLPAGAAVLDAGCGHGEPVLRRLLDDGFSVTGSDLSPNMLDRARQQFPRVKFVQQATTALRFQAEFDGVCSFNSLCYLDPIDFLNSIHRIARALKPGGLLFIYGFDSAPDWRGEPFGHRVGQWMWAWHYGMEEAAGLVEEHGFFKVLATQKVQVDEGEEERMAQEMEKRRQEEEEYRQRQAEDPDRFFFPFFNTPIERSAYAYVITAERL